MFFQKRTDLYLEKKIKLMQKIFSSKKLYVGIILSTIIIFLMLINFRRAYVSTSYILVIPKSDTAAINSEQIIENLSFIPTTWNSKLEIKRLGKSGILAISILDANRHQAESINNSTIQKFIKTVGFYYDIKNDIDVRIIDEITNKESTTKAGVMLFFSSLISGFVLTVIFLFTFSYLFEKKKAIENIRPDIFNFRKSFSKKEQGMEDLNKIILKEEEEIKPLDFFEKDQIFPIKKAAAPDNLPIAPEEIEKTEKIVIAPQPIIREATAEEVKERLNKLLSGIGM
jgi:hypothetical protein